MMQLSQRYLRLPPYLFAGLERKAAELKSRGVDLIDLGIGDPDLPSPDFFMQSMKRHLDDPDAHLYPASKGDPQVRRSIAEWFSGRFQVDLDPDTEICVLIGAKEGLANFTRAVVDPGDKVGVPDPGYPVYGQAGAILNDAESVALPLIPEKGFVPDLNNAAGCKLLFLNYPNNPTGATAPDSFFKEVAEFVEKNPETIVAHDAAYSEMAFGDYHAPSLLQETRRVIEFHSMSKLFNATGYRIGFAAGRPELIQALAATKSQLDSGAPVFIQRAMADGLRKYDGMIPPLEVRQNLLEYQRRRELVEASLSQMNLEVLKSNATFYVWAKVGEYETSFIENALEKGVILTPGRGFGASGSGYIRVAVCQSYDRIQEAMQRLMG
ncbi:aminotransferase class I/II-fold pyridoxal phosphate-dependent enzyme [bacterium]|nr:aminotransferase class I/II-fold pyridoxal phosphate-dependent enzyme [bacterium]